MFKNLIVCLLFPLISFSQRLEVDLFAGMSNYQGDLQAAYFTLQGANPAASVGIKYGFTDKLYLRSAFMFGSLSASDADNKPKNRARNLNFRTALQEFTLGAEYHILSLDKYLITPLLLAGVGVYHFNPYTYYNAGNGLQRYYLQPLSTEGQGLAQYPDRKAYKLTQWCLFYGVGLRVRLTENLNLGFEFRQTKTNSDYIDDVSTTYVNQSALLAAKGPIAVKLAWRRDEYDGTPYPFTDKTRGNPNQDLFYFAGATLGVRLFNSQGDLSLGGLFGGGSNAGSRRLRSQVGCPRF